MKKLIKTVLIGKYIGLFGIVALGFFGLSASAQSSQYSLSLSTNVITEGETVAIEWTAPAGDNLSQDWIGLYQAGSDNRAYIKWSYLNSSTNSGTLSFTIDSPGTYEFRYLKNNYYEQVARSLQIIVEPYNVPIDPPPDGNYTLTVTNDTYQIYNTLTASWSAPANRSIRQGWIGLYPVGASDRAYEDWKYINQSDNSGTVSLTLRSIGTYELRFFAGNGYERMGRSRSFSVTESGGQDDPLPTGNYELTVNSQSLTTGERVVVSWTANPNNNLSQDWIGLYQAGSDNRAYIKWSYLNSSTNSGTLSFTIDSPGTYEFRYLKNNQYTQVATSPRIVVANSFDDPILPQCPVANLNSIINYPPHNGPIIALGDSLTEGVGAPTNRDYVSQLEDLLDVSIRNEGMSGHTTQDALDRLSVSILAHDPSIVIVWLGGNDILGRYYARVLAGLEQASALQRLELLALQLAGKIPDTTNISEEETFRNLETIINRIQANGAVAILVGFSGGVFRNDLEVRYQTVALETGSMYVPNIMEGIIGRPRLMSDLVHPNASGYALVAEKIAPYLSCLVQ